MESVEFSVVLVELSSFDTVVIILSYWLSRLMKWAALLTELDRFRFFSLIFFSPFLGHNASLSLLCCSHVDTWGGFWVLRPRGDDGHVVLVLVHLDIVVVVEVGGRRLLWEGGIPTPISFSALPSCHSHSPHWLGGGSTPWWSLLCDTAALDNDWDEDNNGAFVSVGVCPDVRDYETRCLYQISIHSPKHKSGKSRRTSLLIDYFCICFRRSLCEMER